MPARKLSVAAILRTKAQIQRDMEMWKWIGTEPTGDEFAAFVADVRRRLPGDLDFDVVFDSLAYLAGQEIADKNLDAALWRLLGNLERLRDGVVVPPWAAQHADEWLPVQVMSVDRQLSRNNDPGGDFLLQALAGSCCPLLLKKFWTWKFAGMLARRLGFTPPWGKYPFRDILELVNCRFHVLVEQRLSGKAPGFEEVHVTKTQTVWNRKYLRMRQRPPRYFDCPFGYALSHACANCHVGLDQCPAAVHNKTYVQRPCEACRQADAYFDPAKPERKICQNCFYQQLVKRRHER